MTSVLAIDPGNQMGWAYVRDGKLVASDTWHLANPGETDAPRFWRLFHRLGECASDYGVPDFLAYETKLGFGTVSTANLLNTGGLIGVLKAWAFECDIDGRNILSMLPNVLKKAAAGHGHAKKPEMVAAACRLSGKHITDDNEADAVCLAFVTYQEQTK